MRYILFMNKKQCKCGETNEDNFYKSTRTVCKKCYREKQLKRYYSLDDSGRANLKQKRDEWVSKNYLHYRLTNTRARAKLYGLEFSLDINDLKEMWDNQGGLCYYTGKPMVIGPSERRMHCVSIDRVDSGLGYTRDNVVLCRGIVNLMKNELSIDEFLEIIDQVRNIHPIVSGC
jgi:hypothetical protein